MDGYLLTLHIELGWCGRVLNERLRCPTAVWFCRTHDDDGYEEKMELAMWPKRSERFYWS